MFGRRAPPSRIVTNQKPANTYDIRISRHRDPKMPASTAGDLRRGGTEAHRDDVRALDKFLLSGGVTLFLDRICLFRGQESPAAAGGGRITVGWGHGESAAHLRSKPNGIYLWIQGTGTHRYTYRGTRINYQCKTSLYGERASPQLVDPVGTDAEDFPVFTPRDDVASVYRHEQRLCD